MKDIMEPKSISPWMISALKAQNEMFTKLKEVIETEAQNIFGHPVELTANYWGGNNFRSYLMRAISVDGSNQGAYPYGWVIYLDKPHILVLEDRTKTPYSRLHSLNLSAVFYFSMLEDEKRRILTEFVQSGLRSCNPGIL